MSSGKGRKKGRNRERARSGGTTGDVQGESATADAITAKPAAPSRQQTVPPPRMPSPMARITGAILAVFTGGVAVYMVMNGLADESASAGIARIVGGMVMVVIAAVVGVLSVAPELVLRIFGRRLP